MTIRENFVTLGRNILQGTSYRVEEIIVSTAMLNHDRTMILESELLKYDQMKNSNKRCLRGQTINYCIKEVSILYPWLTQIELQVELER